MGRCRLLSDTRAGQWRRAGVFKPRRQLRAQRSSGSGAAGSENPPSLVGTMEKVRRAERREQLAADLSPHSSWQGYSDMPSCFQDDPYADSSIVSGTQSDLPMDQREARRLVMKRKVLRHRPDGRVEVSEESPSIKSDINTCPWNLGHSRTYMEDAISEGGTETTGGNLEDFLHYEDDEWFLEDRPYSLLGDFGSNTVSERAMPRERSPVVPAYIAPQAERVRRTDPVARLNAYRQDWQRFRFPGQDSHQGLRWATRTQMLQSGLPRQAQKRLVPNTYQVPTTKKRDSLRFGVRYDLAHCNMPRRNTTS
ncbi:centriolar and ciliogenesis-associated protein HYLS1 [Melospiza georgiana]|uniref:centriolar and ciliogenesis-associated protein HYLS1 n=1 Tax=Melospiza georgiana TaxID=44398 RepID=UPI0025AC290E|nr:centriolar and ciliogenesis-associated protein HYLS1 [Melospiza georgiana]